jgi:hypothetical protein
LSKDQTPPNSNLLGYGLEGLTNPAPHALYCTSNTFINKKTTGSFIQVANGTDTALREEQYFCRPQNGGLFIGTAAVWIPQIMRSIIQLLPSGLVDASGYDYHLQPHPWWWMKALDYLKLFMDIHSTASQLCDTCHVETRELNCFP